MFLIPKEELVKIERKFFSLALHGTVEELSQFLDTEANFCINACTSAEMGHLTALHYAVLSHNLAKIKLLIRHGADINAYNIRGKTPIWMLFDLTNSVETSRENINAIWNYLVRHRAHVPSYEDLDPIEKEVMNDNMAIYEAIFSILKSVPERKMLR